MFSKYGKNFFVGVLIGTLVCLLYWYYEKSTQAEDGALDLLDRLKRAEDRLRGVVSEAQTAVSAPKQVDDLTAVKGIGPVFADRLEKSGITSLAQLKALTTDQLVAVLNIQSGRAEQILKEAVQSH